MGLLTDSNAAIEGMLTGITEAFKGNIRATILKRLTAQMQEELEAIATEEAARLTQIAVNYYTNPMECIGVMQYRLTINKEEVASGHVEKQHDRT